MLSRAKPSQKGFPECNFGKPQAPERVAGCLGPTGLRRVSRETRKKGGFRYHFREAEMVPRRGLPFLSISVRKLQKPT